MFIVNNFFTYCGNIFFPFGKQNYSVSTYYFKLVKIVLLKRLISLFCLFDLQFINLCIYNMPGHDLPYFGMCCASTKNFLSLFCTFVLRAIRLADGDMQKNQSRW